MSSHYLHLDMPGDRNQSWPERFTGSVTFDEPVLGIIAFAGNLASSDALRGAPVGHPQGFRTRYGGGREGLSDGDTIVLSADRRTVSYNMRPLSSGRNHGLRVVTDSSNAEPETVIESGPDGVHTSTTAGFTFSSPDAATGFECSMDSAPYGGCVSITAQFYGLAQGPHVFQVRALRSTPDGNVRDASPATRVFYVETAGGAVFSGGISQLLVAPPSVQMDALQAQTIRSFRERQNVTLGSVLNLSGALSATYDYDNEGFLPASIAAGTEVSSHLLHLDSASSSPPSTVVSGSVRYQDEVLGVIWDDARLDASDAILGRPATLYPNGLAGRGVDLNTVTLDPRDRITISADRHTVSVTMAVKNKIDMPMDQLRIVTTPDHVKPDTTIFEAPASPTETRTARFTFKSSELESTFECRLEAVTSVTPPLPVLQDWAPCTSPKTYSNLVPAQYKFNVRAVDAAGNKDDVTPAEHVWDVNDLTPPDTTITSGPAEGSTDSSVNTKFTFTSNETGSTFKCKLDDGEWNDCVSGKTYPHIGHGTHTFQVYAIDRGNLPDPVPATRTWFHDDTTLPDTVIIDKPSDRSIEHDAQFTFASNESQATFKCWLYKVSASGAILSTLNADEVCNSRAFYAFGLLPGRYRFEVIASDLKPNADPTSAKWSWWVTDDNVDPDTILLSHPVGLLTPQWISVNQATFTFTATEDSTYQCAFGPASTPGSFSTCTSPKTYSGLANGAYKFLVRAVDKASPTNTDKTPAEWTVSVDTTVPNTFITSNPTVVDDATEALFTFNSNEPDPFVTYECWFDNGPEWASCVSPQAYAELLPGPHQFKVRAADRAGNVDLSPASYSWTVTGDDLTAPEVQIIEAPPTTTELRTAHFEFFSPEFGATFECQLDEATTWTACASPTDLSGLASGTHTLRVRGTDAANNKGPQQSWTWNVDLPQARPTITYAESNAPGQVVIHGTGFLTATDGAVDQVAPWTTNGNPSYYNSAGVNGWMNPAGASVSVTDTTITLTDPSLAGHILEMVSVYPLSGTWDVTVDIDDVLIMMEDDLPELDVTYDSGSDTVVITSDEADFTSIDFLYAVTNTGHHSFFVNDGGITLVSSQRIELHGFTAAATGSTLTNLMLFGSSGAPMASWAGSVSLEASPAPFTVTYDAGTDTPVVTSDDPVFGPLDTVYAWTNSDFNSLSVGSGAVSVVSSTRIEIHAISTLLTGHTLTQLALFGPSPDQIGEWTGSVSMVAAPARPVVTHFTSESDGQITIHGTHLMTATDGAVDVVVIYDSSGSNRKYFNPNGPRGAENDPGPTFPVWTDTEIAIVDPALRGQMAYGVQLSSTDYTYTEEHDLADIQVMGTAGRPILEGATQTAVNELTLHGRFILTATGGAANSITVNTRDGVIEYHDPSGPEAALNPSTLISLTWTNESIQIVDPALGRSWVDYVVLQPLDDSYSAYGEVYRRILGDDEGFTDPEPSYVGEPHHIFDDVYWISDEYLPSVQWAEPEGTGTGVDTYEVCVSSMTGCAGTIFQAWTLAGEGSYQPEWNAAMETAPGVYTCIRTKDLSGFRSDPGCTVTTVRFDGTVISATNVSITSLQLSESTMSVEWTPAQPGDAGPSGVAGYRVCVTTGLSVDDCETGAAYVSFWTLPFETSTSLSSESVYFEIGTTYRAYVQAVGFNGTAAVSEPVDGVATP